MSTMHSRFHLVATLCLAVAALWAWPATPASAIPGSLQVFEGSVGAGNTLGVDGPLTSRTIDIDFDTNTAEGLAVNGFGSFLLQASGDLSFDASSLNCQMDGCVFPNPYLGGQTVEVNSLATFSDGRTDALTIDLTGTLGEVMIMGTYVDNTINFEVRDIVPFTVVQVIPEPGTAALLGLGLVALRARRRAS